MKILIAEDDAILRNELAGLLLEDGHVLAPMGLAATSENEVTEQVMNLREPSLTV